MRNKKGNKPEDDSTKKELPSCCVNKKTSNGLGKGLVYGLIPHIGCVLFIIGAVLGSNILIQFFKPLLMNKNIFYYLIFISIVFASFSSYLYLRKNKMCSV